jgi:hypothetical protein
MSEVGAAEPAVNYWYGLPHPPFRRSALRLPEKLIVEIKRSRASPVLFKPEQDA